MLLSDGFVQRQIEVHGTAGREWLDGLPALLMDLARRWSLALGQPFPNLSYNYAAPAARADGTAAVLKVGVPHKELLSEIAALRLFDGRGAVRLLEADPAIGALLLERVEPGTPLLELEERDGEEATRIAATVMRQLWRPAPVEHSFPTVARWELGFTRLRARFGGGTGPLPAALVEEAERLFAELDASAAAPALLHGDLNYGNSLRAGAGRGAGQPWLAIDPKGLVGEPAYETGVLLRDPLPRLLRRPQPGGILARRVDLLAEALGFERERIRGWGLAQAVLSAWWSIEDHGHGWEGAVACAELLREI